MNLLVLSPWFPYPPDNGSRIRAFHLIRALAQRHRVRLVAGVQEDVAESRDAGCAALGALCDEVTTFPWRWWQSTTGAGTSKLRSLLSPTPRSIEEADNPEGKALVAAELAKSCDAVLIFELGMIPLLPAGGTLPPTVVDQVEVSGFRQAVRRAQSGAARLRAALTAWKAYNYWRRALGRFAALTAVSEDEARAVRGVIGRETPPVVVVPNGVDVEAYRRAAGRSVPGRLIYNGALSYGPNLDAVRWFAGEVLPRVAQEVPEAHLVVTGRSEGLPIEDLRADRRVHLTGFLTDLRPALDEAVACVVPLRSGGGTRLKILEAWAAELPVIATRVGAAGLDARDGEHLLLADTPPALAEATVRLLREPERVGAPLARRARRLVRERYDWPAIGARLADLLETTAGATPTREPTREGNREKKAL